MKLILILAGVMIFVLGIFFGFAYCDFTDNTCEDTSIVTFLHNDSFSAIMPLEPGENVVINLQNDTPVAFVQGNCWIFYSVTEDGFRDYNCSKECYE